MTAKLQLVSEDGHLKLTCGHCKKLKFITEFKKKINSSTGYTSICKPCCNSKERELVKTRLPKTKAEQARERYRKTQKYRDTFWASHLKRKYNLSVTDYENLLRSQDYCCAICGTQEAHRNWQLISNRVNLFVDHNHSTGKVRGMLCNKCNVGIAMFQEKPDVLLAAINYIKEHTHGLN